MTRQKQKDMEVKVLEIFQNHYYDNFIFSCSESPDFISVENNLGVEIVEYHGINLNRQIEVKIKKHINKAKSLYNEKNKPYISVYMIFDDQFIKYISKRKQEYFEKNFSIDLASLTKLMMKESINEMTNKNVKEFNLDLSNVISWISIGISEKENNHWQMTNAYCLDIDRKTLEKTIKKKEEKLIDYLNRPEIKKIVLLIYTISAPTIGLSKNDSWSSSVGSLRLSENIEKIKSSFYEIYIIDMDNNMALQINY